MRVQLVKAATGLSGSVLYWLVCLVGESGFVPDWLVRFGIRKLLDKESRVFRAAAKQHGTQALNDAFVATILGKPITFQPEAKLANEQHYEVPASFFQLALGPRKKYSLCDWTVNGGAATLGEAETNTLTAFAQFANVVRGQFRLGPPTVPFGPVQPVHHPRHTGCL